MCLPPWSTILYNCNNIFFTTDRRESAGIRAECYCSDLIQILVFGSKYYLQETSEPRVTGSDIWRTRSPYCWKMRADNPCIRAMLFQQITLHKDQYEEVYHPAWEWCLQVIHAIKVAGLQNLSSYHGNVVLWQNKFEFYLQLSLKKKIRFSEKSSCKTTSYCHFFRMQGLFLDSGVRVCPCPNSTITGVNLSIEAKVGFVTSQNVLWPIDDNNYPRKELQGRSFMNL